MQLLDDQKQKDFLRKFKDVNRKIEEEQTAQRSGSFGVPYVDLHNFPVDLNALALWTYDQSLDSHAIIFYKDGNDLRLGTVDPNNAILQKNIENLKSEHFKPSIYYISKSSLQENLAKYNKVVKPSVAIDERVDLVSGLDYVKQVKEVLSDSDRTWTATEIISNLFGAAKAYRASDIHVEPEEHFVKVRLRLDGVLTDIGHLSSEYHKALVSRIKILSHLKLNLENTPQDGRCTFYDKGTPTDVRVSILPSAYGEEVVMRILSDQAVSLHLDDLGFIGKSREIIERQLQKPNGMILTTGPTGSGKTTTLYAFLNQMNTPGVKIITLEDPVEYKLEGIIQTPINSTSGTATSGVTFATGLRAILRQDPDVIMVGEIRDAETAETALQAALTGHVVLSTLHTNDAAGAVPRLVNMGVKPFVIAPAINAIIAQRLVRRLCTVCKKEVQLNPIVLEKVLTTLKSIPVSSGQDIKDFAAIKFYAAPGCEACNGTGYKGRIGIYEVIEKSDKLDSIIMSAAPASEIKNYAVESGMITMMQDGFLKAMQGLTDVEEVFRVTQE